MWPLPIRSNIWAGASNWTDLSKRFAFTTRYSDRRCRRRSRQREGRWRLRCMPDSFAVATLTHPFFTRSTGLATAAAFPTAGSSRFSTADRYSTWRRRSRRLSRVSSTRLRYAISQLVEGYRRSVGAPVSRNRSRNSSADFPLPRSRLPNAERGKPNLSKPIAVGLLLSYVPLNADTPVVDFERLQLSPMQTSP
jgi:hypothetical protein